ncbi:hypothetical protein QVD17_09523 [Tagetes erecta]|uniref:Uncharacterized protein n=1 Tax=Tagetes erecta TaxID=13708 RepID=A0AAD8L7I4_TARER|nr:hypothetical protein QVD17_09523 [Tagetes erecta]
MALLPLYRLVIPQSYFQVCKPKPNIQQIVVDAKSRQHHFICSAAKTKVSQTDTRSVIYQPTIWTPKFIQVLDDNFPINLKEKMRELEKKVEALHIDFENGSFSELEVLEHVDDIERLGPLE